MLLSRKFILQICVFQTKQVHHPATWSTRSTEHAHEGPKATTASQTPPGCHISEPRNFSLEMRSCMDYFFKNSISLL